MSAPKWARDMDAGIGALVAELETARDGDGGVVDWPALVSRAKGLGAHLVAAEADYRGLVTDANKRLAEASRQLQAQSRPGVGQPAGQGSQTVYISAGATAGIAAGALLLGGVGGYAAKAMLDGRKAKKAAEAKENPTRELPAPEEPEETDEPEPEEPEAPRRRRAKR